MASTPQECQASEVVGRQWTKVKAEGGEETFQLGKGRLTKITPSPDA